MAQQDTRTAQPIKYYCTLIRANKPERPSSSAESWSAEHASALHPQNLHFRSKFGLFCVRQV